PDGGARSGRTARPPRSVASPSLGLGMTTGSHGCGRAKRTHRSKRPLYFVGDQSFTVWIVPGVARPLAHKKGAVDLSAFHGTQGRRIVTTDIRFGRLPVHRWMAFHRNFFAPPVTRFLAPEDTYALLRVGDPVSTNPC